MPLECCICTDVLVAAEIRVSSTPCGHVYHTPCIFDWIDKCENGANCPVCRRTFQSSEVVPLDVVSDEDVTAIAKAISEQVTLKNANEEGSLPLQPSPEPLELPFRRPAFIPFQRPFLDVSESDDSYSIDDEEPLDDGNILDAQSVDLDEIECDYIESPDESDASDVPELDLSLNDCDESENLNVDIFNQIDVDNFSVDSYEENNDYQDDNFSNGDESVRNGDTILEDVSDVHELDLSFNNYDESENLDIENDDFAEVDDDIYTQNDVDNESFDGNNDYQDDFDDNDEENDDYDDCWDD